MSLSSRRRVIKSEARNILFSSFFLCICLSVIFLSVLCGVSAMLFTVDLLLYEIFSPKVFYSLMVLFKLTMLVLFAPLITGVFRCFRCVSCKVKHPVCEVLQDYTSKKLYLSSLKLVALYAIIIIFILLLPQFAAFVLDILENKISFGGQNRLVSAVSKVLFLMISLLAFTLSCGFVCIMRCDDGSLLSAMKKSISLMKGHKIEFLYFCISFVPWFLLSYITLGVLYLFVVPYFLISVSCFLNYVVTENVAPVFCDFS